MHSNICEHVVKMLKVTVFSQLVQVIPLCSRVYETPLESVIFC